MIKLLLIFMLVSCSGKYVFNTTLQDTSIGDQTNVTKTNTQKMSILQKMDEIRNTKIQITPELKKEIDRGVEDAKKYMANLNKPKPISYNKDADFFAKNKRIHSCRPEIRWVAEHAWNLGLRYLVVECHRSKERQLALYNKGASQLKFGMHNYDPSHAIDFCPVHIATGKLMWKNLKQFAYSIGIFRTLTHMAIDKFGWPVYFRSGRDWKRTDTVYQPTTLSDWAHWEIRDKKVERVSMKEVLDKVFEEFNALLIANRNAEKT